MISVIKITKWMPLLKKTEKQLLNDKEYNDFTVSKSHFLISKMKDDLYLKISWKTINQ